MELYQSFESFLFHSPYLSLLLIFIAAILLFYLCRSYLNNFVSLLTRNLPGLWNNLFVNSQILNQVSWILPLGVIHNGTKLITELPEGLALGIQKISLMLFVIMSVRALNIFLKRLNEAYSTLEIAKNRPIKGFIQIIIVIIYLVAFILMIAIISEQSPWYLISGLGAMTAVILLIFRDTILSFVAGIQLISNNLLQVGDWIEMPQFNADGDVIDIALNAVRVQNWDKTITIIPTHKFLEHSFKNWRGMQQSGGRRIKRAVHVDISSIRFLTEEEISTFENFLLLREYIQQKRNELEEYNRQFAPGLEVNARRLTNVGTFRAYLTNYLKQHPMIHQNMTFLVRQLAPGEHGLPIEIYVFVKDVRWAIYEQTQADIFDHVLAISSKFGLRIHQSPSGHDFRHLYKE